MFVAVLGWHLDGGNRLTDIKDATSLLNDRQHAHALRKSRRECVCVRVRVFCLIYRRSRTFAWSSPYRVILFASLRRRCRFTPPCWSRPRCFFFFLFCRILRAIGRVLFEVNALKDAGDAFDKALAIDSRVSEARILRCSRCCCQSRAMQDGGSCLLVGAMLTCGFLC